ncbi:MAG: alkaline phosphatase [Spirochaetaceae bacterium]|nr:alkaline phosphatase [Spirochaetaceae bacterium]
MEKFNQKKLIKRFALAAAVAAVFLGSCSKPAELSGGNEYSGKAPKYIFLFIGDGTSIPQRNAAELFLASENNPKNMDYAVLREEDRFPKDNGVTDFKPTIQRMLMSGFPGQGFSSTYSANSLITDSSSSATAIATGKKTRDGVVSMDPDAKEDYYAITKMARDKGLKVGIVTTVSLDHATPAAFYANSPHRNFYYEIAKQIPESQFNYFGGGGFKQPRGPKGEDPDVGGILTAAGYKVLNTRADFDNIKSGDDKIITSNPVLDGDSAMPYAIDQRDGEIRFSEFIAKGIEVLDNPKGFFMMAECGKVDWACHANDAVAAVNDVLTLDAGVKVAYEFYLKHPDDTLIIVTGDHETGGLAIGFAGTKYDAFLTKFKHQKGSYLAFNKVLAEFKQSNPNAKFEDSLPLIEDFFGLKKYSKAEIATLNEEAKKGSVEALDKLGMALKDYELADLSRAFAITMKDPASRPTSDDEYYLSYGYYEPFTVTLTHILDQKAGVAWTTYSHTGLPTPVSVIGVGHKLFDGYFDNTDIFKKVAAIGKL